MATNSNQQGVPATTENFVGDDGKITIGWYRFLVTLWKRTGGNNPPSAITRNVNAIGAILGLEIRCPQGLDTSITAEEITLVDASGNPATFHDVSLTFNPAGVGINQMDGSPWTIGTPIYIFVISDGTRLATIGTTFKNAPLLPFGYTFAKMVSAVCGQDAGTHIIPFAQTDRTVTYLTPVLDLSFTNGGFDPNPVPFSVTVPPLVLWMFVACARSTGTADIMGLIFLPTFYSFTALVVLSLQRYLMQLVFYRISGVNFYNNGFVSQSMIDDLSRSSYYMITGSGSTTIDLDVSTIGYEIPFI